MLVNDVDPDFVEHAHDHGQERVRVTPQDVTHRQRGQEGAGDEVPSHGDGGLDELELVASLAGSRLSEQIDNWSKHPLGAWVCQNCYVE